MLRTGENPAVKIKVSIDERDGQIARIGRDQVPAQVGFPTGQILLFDLSIYGLKKIGRGHVEAGQRSQSNLREIYFPRKRRRQLLKVFDRHLVVELLRIATLDTRQMAFGQLGLNPQHGGGFGGGHFRLIA